MICVEYVVLIRPVSCYCPQVFGVYRQDASVSVSRQSLISRRRMLTAVGAGATVALAGCSGNSQDDSGNGENEPEDTQAETESPTENTESETVESQDTETPTETESRFSTEGNNSELIDRPTGELNLEMSDLPGNNWETMGAPVLSGVERQSNRGFLREGDRFEGLFSIVILIENVDDCRELYNHYNIQRITGGLEPDESRELGIAVSSQWSFTEYEPSQDEYDQAEFHLLKLRDANGFGTIQWRRYGDSIPISAIGALGVTMHEKWR